MEGDLISLITVIQGMCPALNHWRQLVVDPEVQSRAPSVEPACRLASQDDMALSTKDEVELFKMAMATEDSMRKRCVEKQFQDISAGPVDAGGGDGRASIQVASDDTGEMNSRTKESLVHFISTVMNWKRNSVEINWKENPIKVNWREREALDGVEVEEDTLTPGR